MIDLSNNTTPYGLLTPEEQKHLRGWGYKNTEYWGGSGWCRNPNNDWAQSMVFRTIPKPKRVEWWNTRDRNGGRSIWYGLESARDDVEGYGGTIYHITTDEDGKNPKIEVVE